LLINPGFTRCGDASRFSAGLPRLVGDHETAAQGMPGFDGFHGRQLCARLCRRHAVEGDAVGDAQAKASCFGLKRQWHDMVGRNQGIGTEQLGGIARQALLDPAGDKADTGQRQHCDEQRHAKQAEFTCAQVATQHLESKAKGVHRQLSE